MRNVDTIAHLMAAFSKLPSVGQRTAYRYAYAVLKMSEEEVREFAQLLIDAKTKVRFCSLCGNYTEEEQCELCRTKDKTQICVVAEPKDVLAIEACGTYSGVYHILGGLISPRERIGVEQLRVKELIGRLDGVREVILATNPSAEGEVTALYIAKLLKPLGVEVTRIAFGLPVGANIEYTDEVTLGRALQDRKKL